MVLGEAIALNAYALPPLTVTGLGAGVESISISLAVLTTIIVGLRVWVRGGFSGAGNKVWGADDYLLLVGFLPFVPSIIFAVYAVRYGVGLHDADMPSILYHIRAAEYVIYWEILYFISSTIVKCAIGIACIRIDQRRRIIYPIATNMTIMVTTAILALIFVFTNCKPLAATWNPYLGTCQKTITLETVSYIVSSIQMATDWTCAMIPWFILKRLQMSLRKKVSVMMILGLGIIASIATCVRMPYLKYYDTTAYPDDLLYHLATIIICSNIECSLGIIACSLPSLRKLFRYHYGSSHSPSSIGRTGNLETYGTKLVSLTPHGKYDCAIYNQERTGEWDRLEDEDTSARGIVKQTDIYMTSA